MTPLPPKKTEKVDKNCQKLQAIYHCFSVRFFGDRFSQKMTDNRLDKNTKKRKPLDFQANIGLGVFENKQRW